MALDTLCKLAARRPPERNSGDQHTSSGTWDQLGLHPTTLVKMVVAGTATVVGKDKFGRLVYHLRRQPPTEAQR